ncbi:MAG TPA: SRPBCC family protein [Caulobacteraceae bacterium]|nr:SRPBCC family protein [Caulobacteraceae bacterium]
MSMRNALIVVVASALALWGATARAELAAAQPYGFVVSHKLVIAAPPERVWAALGRIGDWWASEHAYSRDAHNLRLSLEVGGCWCEQLPGGGAARHMTVIAYQPGRILVLEGGLGPLGSPGAPSGHLTFSLAPDPKGAALSVTFEGGGLANDGLAQWAPPIDRVLGEQAARLKRYVESGRPD